MQIDFCIWYVAHLLMTAVRNGEDICRVTLDCTLRFPVAADTTAATTTITAPLATVVRLTLFRKTPRRDPHVPFSVVGLFKGEPAVTLLMHGKNSHLLVPRAGSHVLYAFLSCFGRVRGRWRP